MHYENKILISAILIIGVALISSNVINPDISGRTSGFCSPVSIEAVRDGAYVDVTIQVSTEAPNTNYNGVARRFVDYYRANGEKVGQQTIPRNQVDSPEINVQIPDLETKISKVSVNDKCTNKKIFANVI